MTMETQDLDGAVAFVTGGGSGIGAACAHALAARGARVAVADLGGAADRVAAEIGGEALALTVDVTDEAQVIRATEATVRAFGRLDLAVNSAGVSSPAKVRLGDLDAADWRRVTAVNLDGVFHAMKAEVAAMGEAGGSIVNIASVLGLTAQPLSAAYVAAKHGVIGLTKVGALEYAADGIRVNAVCPAFIETPLLATRPPEVVARLADRHPVGRLGTVEEVAAVVDFLLSASASFVTGACYTVDGAYTAQ